MGNGDSLACGPRRRILVVLVKNLLRRLACRWLDLIPRPQDDDVFLVRHPELKPGESFTDNLPKVGCRYCHGRGALGRLVSDGMFVPCRCLGKVTDQKKLAHRVHIRQGRVVEVVMVALVLLVGAVSGQITNTVQSSCSPTYFADTFAFAVSLERPGELVGVTTGAVLVVWQETFDLTCAEGSWHDLGTNPCPALGSQVLYALRTNAPGAAYYRARILSP